MPNDKYPSDGDDNVVAFVNRTITDDAEIKRLAGLPRFEYERQREAAAEELRCRVGVLDNAVAEERRRSSRGAELWRDSLIVDRDEPKPLLANAITALRLAPAWARRLFYDEFRQRVVVRGGTPWCPSADERPWEPSYDVLAADWLQHEGIEVSPTVAAEAVDVVARDWTFHPVRDYLDALSWDGTPRLDTWLVRYFGADPSDYTRAVGPRWMISATARIYRPGCKADCALILEGPQGRLKSTAFKTLAAPWFSDEIADLGTKDATMQLAGIWIMELAELDSIERGAVAKIKAFLSRTHDRYRPPYGRRVVEVPRQCVFAGTVNHDQYLRDETGGRRFWPVGCGTIDIEGLARERDQLWAEARHRFESGEPWWLDAPALVRDAEVVQNNRYQTDAWAERIREFVAGRMSVSVGEVLEDCLHVPLDRWPQSDQNRVARCLRRLGWERRQARVENDREWRYWPPKESPSPDAPPTGDTGTADAGTLSPLSPLSPVSSESLNSIDDEWGEASGSPVPFSGRRGDAGDSGDTGDARASNDDGPGVRVGNGAMVLDIPALSDLAHGQEGEL